MHVGLDIHGVIDTYPDFFRIFSHNLINNGHSVHIITGRQWEEVKRDVDDRDIWYDHHFSIVDYHSTIETTMELRDTGWWMDPVIWNRTKGDYCKQARVSLHFDNDIEYFEYFPYDCTVIYVPKIGFERIFKELLNGRFQKEKTILPNQSLDM